MLEIEILPEPSNVVVAELIIRLVVLPTEFRWRVPFTVSVSATWRETALFRVTLEPVSMVTPPDKMVVPVALIVPVPVVLRVPSLIVMPLSWTCPPVSARMVPLLLLMAPLMSWRRPPFAALREPLLMESALAGRIKNQGVEIEGGNRALVVYDQAIVGKFTGALDGGLVDESSRTRTGDPIV